MSEQESNIPSTEDEDVELHRKRHQAAGNDEPRDEAETEGDDDVELHGKNKHKAL